ncbi:amino acid adenylation domain-containing protein [Tolypothrix sp. NIES-4075]|uniref:amino acid adenylation domain-containing protein n=1 Tax=Tolypothrix sp. NIES-4075 TaxID=2005459 RepID=UPI000B5CC9A3|nr:non-ribosomal peptide synthetase [Tolypothrix sp. NIES-4075]GAX42390.1 amino acid adenylation domain-containing protein [Tolypothrix sp. NIES-4075]
MQYINNISKSVESDLTYWKQQLEDVSPVLELPTDYQRSQNSSYHHSKQSLVLSQRITQALKNLSHQQKVNLDIILLAAFKILLYRYTGTEKIVVAAAIGDRNHKTLQEIASYRLPILPLRTNLVGNPSLPEFIGRVGEVILEADEHQNLPWEQLVKAIDWEESSSYHPLLQVMFIWQNSKRRSQELSSFDLSLELEQTSTEINGYFEYRTDLFKAETISRMVGHFQTLLEGIVANPERGIAELPLLTPKEQQQILVDWNDTATDYPRDKCIHELFAQQVARNPEAVAVVFAGQQMTYGELNTRANQLAHYLQSLGVGSEVVVGICLERSLEMIVSVIAILKAGGAYLPLDPSYPLDRLEFMLFDAQVPVLITMSALKENLPNHTAQVICLDSQQLAIAQQSPENPINQTHPHNLAYIIYTSGSTGKPKGTMIEQRSLVNAYLAWEDAYYLSSQTTSHLQMASFSFDVFSGDLVRALCSGAKLVLSPRDFLLDAQQLYGLMRQEKVDCAEFVPAVLRNLVQYLEQTNQNLDFMKLLVAGSDSWYLSEYKHIQSLCGSQTRLINSYGVSEATIDSSYFETEVVDLSVDQLIPIGRPFANNQIYILDANMQPVPIGVSGELYIGGAGLARGYLNRLDLTQEKFVKSPFADYFPTNQDTRLYKTNDKARYLADGNIEFLGRIDNQVKIRGFRIELGEIEALVSQHPKIQGSIVTVREDVPGDRYLVGYVVPLTGQEITDNEMRNFLKVKLPTHMVPSAFVILDALPLTPNGKIDRRALPAPDRNSLIKEDNFVPPRTATEKACSDIWCQILGLKRIGIHDNFFDLGGHSLLVSQVLGYCWQEFSVELAVRQFFQAPTVADLATVIEQYQNQGINVSNYKIIPQRINQKSVPLSFAQQRLWFLEQLEPRNANYHICEVVRINGSLSVTALQQSLDAIVACHEVLRTNFILEDGSPVQVINAAQVVELTFVDLQDYLPTERQTQVQRHLQQESQRPFNFSKDLMLRGCLLQIAPQEHILLLVMHHIASDGWSIGVLWNQLKEFYTAFLNGEPIPLPTIPIQYADFAVWQRQWLSGQELENQLNYWKQQLADANPVLELATDYPRPPVQTYRNASQSLVLNQDLTVALRAISRQEGVTLFMTLLAAFQTLLYRYSGQEDIIVGSPIAGRNRTELKNLIGFFVNTLVLRTNLSGNPSFRELLAQVSQVALNAYTHQEMPFQKLVEELKLERDLSRNPLFQVWFNMLNLGDIQLELPGLTVESVFFQEAASKFDLNLYLQEQNQGIQLELNYNADLFTPERMMEMLHQFHHLLNQIVANPEASIAELSLVTPTAEAILPNPQKLLPCKWAGAVHANFSQQAQRVPQQVAVLDSKITWTYAELEERTNLLANYLLAHIQPQEIVAIYGHRSAELVWAILGVLKAGAAFVILDPAYPTSRLIDYLQISQPRAFIQITAARELPAAISASLDLSCCCRLQLPHDSMVGIRRLFADYATDNPEVSVEPDNLAYVAFTSGSTGKPKGILGTHRPLSHFLQWHCETFGLNESDKFSMLSGLSHDPLLRDIFTPLSLGATLCIPQQQDIETPGQLSKWMQQKQVSIAHLTPAMGQLLSANTKITAKSLRYLFFGGDILTVHDVNKISNFAPHARCVNFYGATETPQAMGYFIVPKQDERILPKDTIPVGRGIADVQLLVLNIQKQLAGIGELGEIYVRTPYLSQGYIGSNELTGERFITNHFSKITVPEDRLYKTGDLGRYLPNGDIEFFGRSDYQVKIRGFRVELGEIEALLSQHPAIKDNVAIAREDVLGHKRLVAYIVLKQKSALTATELRQFLKKQLPNYMIPSAFVMLEVLPLTPNGKIDRNALPTPDYVRQEPEEAFAAPHDELEIHLTKIWEKVLGVQPIGIKDNFFELGGHSLIAVLLFAEIEKTFGKTLPLATLFQAQTIEELAAVCRNEQWSAPWSPLVLIQPGGAKPPLFFIHPIGGNILEYSDIIHCLGQERPIYGLQALGLDGKQAPLNRVEDMAEYYIKEIRTILPNGPYFLAGYSFGGLVAFEMAQQLHSQGQKVGLLALLDKSAPTRVETRPSLTKYLRVHLSNLSQLNIQEKLLYVKGLLQWYLNKGSYKDILIQNLPEVVENSNIINVIEANIQASKDYIAKAYPGVLTLFRCSLQPVRWFDCQDLGWGDLVGDLEVHALPSDHNHILKKPHVQVLSEKLKSCLEKAQQDNA